MTAGEAPLKASSAAPDDAAQTALVENLRGDIAERVKMQGQLLGVAALIAGAAASFGVSRLPDRPEILALLGLLFVGLALAMVRMEYLIAVVEDHLVDQDAFGRHAIAQARWEVYKADDVLGKKWFRKSLVLATTGGFFILPGLAAVVCTWAALADSPGWLAYTIVSLTLILAVLLVAACIDVLTRYVDVANKARKIVPRPTTTMPPDKN